MSNILRIFVLMILNKKVIVKCLRNGYVLEDAYYKDLLDVFIEHLKLIDDTDLKGKKLELNLIIKEVK